MARASLSSPYVIPFFIPHEGCPHRCVFCNQQAITGEQKRVTGKDVAAEIKLQLLRPRHPQRQVQVAFYGGSFTGLSPSRQAELLGAVHPFLESGAVAAIRLSTRPDDMDGESAGFLRAQGVRIVELGVQSLEPKVLALSGRGHSGAQVERAFGHLRRAGLTVGGQLMLGLPGETSASHVAGLRRLLRLRPDFLRLYPTLVLKGSPLAVQYRAGRYRPLSLPRAVALAARLKEICDRAGVSVVRMGLQPSASLEEDLLAGPYHPAFGELVLARMLFKKAREALVRSTGLLPRTLTVAAADESIFRGPGNCSLKRLKALGLLDNTTVAFSPEQLRHTATLSIAGD